MSSTKILGVIESIFPLAKDESNKNKFKFLDMQNAAFCYFEGRVICNVRATIEHFMFS